MKWFFVISLAVAAAMVLSPFALIKPDAARYDSVVVGYDENGAAIVAADPVVRFGSYGSTVRSIDATTCNDPTSAWIQGHFYEGLYTYHYLKRPLEIVPLLAADLPEVSADGLTYTIRLRPGVRYARNRCFGPDTYGRWATRTVTAEDFVNAFKRAADDHAGAADVARAALAGRVAGFDEYAAATEAFDPADPGRFDPPLPGVRAVDDLTLQIELNAPDPHFIHALTLHNYAPIPREALACRLTEEPGAQVRRPEQIVSTGPYVLRTFEREKRIVLVRNPDFRPMTYPVEGAPGDAEAGLLADAGRPVPFIDVIHLDYVREDYAGWILFLGGEIDSSTIQAELFDSIVTPGRRLTARWRGRGIRLHAYDSPTIYWLTFNMSDPLLAASPSLRRAICLGIDVETYLAVLFNGRGRRAVNCIPSSLEHLDEAGYQVHVQAGPGPYYRYDPVAAGAMLAAARVELAEAGLLADGQIPPLRIDLPGTDAHYVKMGDFFRQQLGRIGLDVVVELNDWSGFQGKVRAGRTQLHAAGLRARHALADSFLRVYYSGDGNGSPGYRNERFDALYVQARSMPPGPERTRLQAEMVSIISEDCPALMLTEPQAFVLTYDWLGNVKPHPVGYGYDMYLRIDTERRRALGGRED